MQANAPECRRKQRSNHGFHGAGRLPAAGEQFLGLPVLWVSQPELSEHFIPKGERQIQNYERLGLLRRGQGRTKQYALPHSLVWWCQYIVAPPRERNSEFTDTGRLPFSVAPATACNKRSSRAGLADVFGRRLR
jgi:hypothetical protein